MNRELVKPQVFLGSVSRMGRGRILGKGDNAMVELIQAVRMAKAAITDRKGVTALEYGIIAGLISVAVVGAAASTGTKLKSYMTLLVSAMT